jgi:Xaa-Pro aminopeptidase
VEQLALDQQQETLYPRFSDAEFERRYQRVRALLSERGLDGLVAFGWSALGRAAQADVQYLSGFLGMRDNYVLFPLRGEPVLFVQSWNHVPHASVVASVADVRWGGSDSGATVGQEIARRGLRAIGLVGPMPYQHHASLCAAAGPDVAVSDLTSAFRRLRVTKSEAELDWLRRGAAYTDAALTALEREARPGLREYELAEIIEHAYLRAGGQTQFYYLASTPMTNPDRCVPAQTLSSRRLQVGDVITTEISIAYGGYAGQGLRTFVLDAEPTALFRDLHAVAEQVYRDVARALRPGATHEAVLDAAELIAQRGYSIRDGLVHGYGVGLLPPSIRTRQTDQDQGQTPWIFEANQTLVIQPNVVTADERAGVQVGDLCVVTPDGAQSLHRFPLQLVQCRG